MRTINFDHNATTSLVPSVRAAMQRCLDELDGNPSSIHGEGRRSRDAVERARIEVAALVGGDVFEIVFTSGGTEANVLGIKGAARAARAQGRPAKIVSSPLEHPSVLDTLDALAQEGFAVVTVPVDALGRIDVAAVEQALREGACLATFALANHELGNLYDIPTLSALAHRYGVWLHCDAVQAVGKVAIDVHTLGVDLLSVSAHKFHGPKGVGALWCRRGIDLVPLWTGGHQERGLRPGTENLVGIVGLGAAAPFARTTLLKEVPHIATLRDVLESRLLEIPGVRIHGDREHRVDNTTNVAIAGVSGELVVMALDLEGVCVSTGAACSSGSVAASPVMRALGQDPEQAREAIRLSLGMENQMEDIEILTAHMPAIVARIRQAY